LYGDNLAVFTSARAEGPTILSFALLVAVVPAAAMSIVDLAVARIAPRASIGVHVGLVFVGAWVATSVIMRSVSLGAWPLDASMTATLAAAATWVYARWRVMREWFGLMALLAPLVLVVFIASAWSLLAPGGPGGVAASTVADIDVVWIQLDEAPLFPLVGGDGAINENRFPGFARLASVSTWYRDAVSVSQRTSVAVPAMLTGQVPDYSRQPLLADYPRNILTLVRDVMDLDVVEEATRLCRGGWCDKGVPDPIPRASFASIVRDAAVVAAHTALPEGLRDRLPAIDEGWGGFGENAPRGDGENLVARSFEQGRERINRSPTGHQSRLEHFQALATRQAESTSPTFRFAHLLLPHRPWLLAPDQRIATKTDSDYRPGTLVDKRRDAYQSLLNQYTAVDVEIGRLVEQLSRTERWDDTMLIVTADHGITFVPGASARDEIDADNSAAVDDIYRVPLFVKWPGTVAPRVDDCPVTVLDIVPTVAEQLGVSPDWPLAGRDLAGACGGRTARTVTWIDGAFEHEFGVGALRERVAFYDAWIDADGSVDDIARTGPYGSLVGTPVPDDAPTSNDVKWTLSNSDAFTHVTDGRFGSVPTRATGLITVRRDFADDEEILIAVDGRFVGVVREVAGLGAWRTTLYSSSLASWLIGAGEHEVSLWVVRGAESPQFTRLGPVSR
ncbi:MAG: hypothetical protein RLY50_783, partial [Actinomycetota bacterium]